MPAKTYDTEDIQVLDYPENIQRRPGMYVGGTGLDALHHLAFELVDNAVDEALAGACQHIRLELLPDGALSVDDDGRGIPVGMHQEKKKPTLELVFTELHTGGKFKEGSYSTSGGLHGVGVKATNALSEWLEVRVRRDGVIYSQRYENGLPVTPVQILDPATDQPVGQVGDKDEAKVIKAHANKKLGTGSLITFKPSARFMDVTDFDFDTLTRRLQVIAFLLPGISVEVTDSRKRKSRAKTFRYAGGLVEYVRWLNESRRAIHRTPIEISGQQNGTSIEAVFQWHTSVDDSEIVSFVNTIPTPDGGKHVAGFKSAVTKAINQFATEKKLGKDKGEAAIRGADTLAGLTAVLKISMHDPHFTSQTKTCLASDSVQGIVHSIVYEGLLEMLRKKMPLGKTIVQQAQAAAQARVAASKARSLVIRRSVLDAADSGLPGKLADVTKGMPTEDTVLYIVEGDSAGGSCKMARDRRHHAILPLRGKPLNVEGVKLTRLLSNNEIKAIIAAVGGGVGADFDVSDVRYGGVAILVDADVDGDHIRTLLYTLFWRYMRPLFENGKLYVAVAPLYMLRKGKQTRYAYTDRERDAVLEQWGRNGVSIQRYKGLGEMNPEQLRETVFQIGDNGPFNESLHRVTVEDVHHANQLISTLMGRSAKDRRSWLLERWREEDAENGENGDDEENGNGDEE
ncbi:MAG: DNA topoisomerase IV subunit B [Chloroflexi bacterium]|nr:DNA topoisomerase IV subunit B [Chloroflexota bacterium]MBU1747610.1 DNA topoisomerase IV subunit B [Chloroflexota bacterium]